MNTTALAARYTVLGCNDEQTVCDHCGKANLAKTVVLRDDEGEIVRFGTSCATRAQAVPGVRTRAQLDRAIHAANAEAREAAHRLSVAGGNLTDRDRLFRNMRARECYGEAVAKWASWYEEAATEFRAHGFYC